MKDFDMLMKAYERDNPKTESGGWIQWKGTDVCIDLDCVCGASGHVDGDFMYQLLCPECGRRYLAGANIKLIELTPEEASVEFHDPYLIAEGSQRLSESSGEHHV